MKSARIRNAAATLKVYLSLDDMAANKLLYPILGSVVAGGEQVSPAWGALAGLGANAAITFMSRRGVRPDCVPDHLKAFAYLYYVAQAVR